MKNNILIIFLIIAIIILSYFIIIVDVKTYDYQIKIGDGMGFNVGNDKFYFGTTMQGGKSTRFLTIKNEKSDMRVIVKAYGELSDRLTISENNFKIKKGEEKAIFVSMNIDDIEKKEYKGKIVFVMTRF